MRPPQSTTSCSNTSESTGVEWGDPGVETQACDCKRADCQRSQDLTERLSKKFQLRGFFARRLSAERCRMTTS